MEDAEKSRINRKNIESAEDHEELTEVLEDADIDISEDLTHEVFEDYIWEAAPEDIDMETLDENPEKIFEDGDFFKWRVRDVAREEWGRNVQQNFEPDFERLPGYDIQLGDTTYHVRGFCHGFQDAGPIEASEEVIEYVRNTVNNYMDKGEVFMEQGLGSLVRADKSNQNYRELHDIDRANQEYPGVMEEADQEMKEEAEEFIEAINDDPELKAELQEVFEGLEETGMMKALKDPEFLREAFIESRAEDLPLHLHSEYEEGFDLHKYVSHSRRTIYQAEEAIENSSTDEVYIVAGLGHVSHMKDYLASIGGEVHDDYWDN